MTIEYAVPRETTSLVKPSKPTFYPQAKIDLQHNQLKHRISIRESDTIYYCSGHEIYALNTDNQKRELVKSLSWEPKCLDAAYDWICAGAEDGQCAFIHIASDRDGQSRARPRQRRVEVDELLPLDLDPMSRSLITRELQSPVSNNHVAAKYDVHHHTLGTQIVNSVTIHKMQSIRRGLEEEIVVITTNNDKTIQIFSLSQSKLLVTLTYPIAMNHATISPDGNLLLAVGDKGQAFFHRRVPFEKPTVVGDKVYSSCSWVAVAEPLLPRTSAIDACFSTGFSPSGHRCAVASEGGIITVYDTCLIADEMEREDAVICVTKTSRPSTRPDRIGAARSMSFSPSPWDLLVVAEDQGRVTVLDLRSPEFTFKQTLELSTDPSDVVLANFSEARSTLEQSQLEIERRFLASHREAIETQDYLAAVTNTADHLEYAVERQQMERDILSSEVEALIENANRLTESERRIVDSIGLRRVQAVDNNPSSATAAPISVNYTPSSSSRHNASSLYSTNVPSSNHLVSTSVLSSYSNRLISNTDDLSSSALLTNAALPGRDHQSRSTASIAEYVHQRNIERERHRTSDRQPRRRSSVVISNSSSRNTINNPSTLAPIGTATPTLSTSPSRLPSSRSNTSPAPPTIPNDTTPSSRTASPLASPASWHTLTDSTFTNNSNDSPSDALTEAGAIVARARREAGVSNTRRPSSETRPLGTSTTTTDPRIYQQTMHSMLARAEITRTELQRTRDRVATRVRDLGQTQVASTGDFIRAVYLSNQSRVGGAVVQGVGWGQDGRSLFVATETGLLEYHINIRERMQWPGVALL